MKVYKKFNSKVDNLLFSSDFHLFHKQPFIHSPRGFSSPEQHTDYLLGELYSLDSDITLIYLGDFALNSNFEQVKSVFNTVKCQIIYILGNHCSYVDKVIQEQKELQYNIIDKFVDVWPIRYNTTTFLGYSGAITVDNQYIYLQHMAPYIWPYYKDSICLTGHSHRSCNELNPETNTQGRILDCGVDNAFAYNNTPFFTWNDINSIMTHKSVKIRDHHGNQ